MLYRRQRSAEAIFRLNPEICKRETRIRDASGKGLGLRLVPDLALASTSIAVPMQQRYIGVRLATMCNGVLGKGFHGEALLLYSGCVSLLAESGPV